MRKQIIFCVALFLLVVNIHRSIAQQQVGQIVINVGIGYSAGFSGFLHQMDPSSQSDFPIGTACDSLNRDSEPLYGYSCTTIIPNIGVCLDYGYTKEISLGIALNYQCETIFWPLDFGGNQNSDKISRTNIAGRFLYYTPFNKGPQILYPYVGLRVGCSFWTDTPSPNNDLLPSHPTFLNNPNAIVPSFQILFGVRYYPFKNIGIHAEFGLGTPYCAETGISFRINTNKEIKTKDAAAPPTHN